MKLGTSLRFLYPTGAHTHALFAQMLAAARAGRPALPVLRHDIYVGESDAEQLHGDRALGFENVMVRHIAGAHDAMLRSFERIGRSLMPAIRSL